MMNWLQNRAEEARQALLDQVSRFSNRQFMEAIVAGCALVALADGTVSAAEKRKMLGFMRQSDELKAFDPVAVVDYFNSVIAKFDYDFEIGRIEALKVVARMKANPEAANVLVKVCCIIGSSDGNFDTDEKEVVADICRELSIDPAKHGLIPA